jgi:hypothetical protein
LVSLREEHGLWVLENRVLEEIGIFGPNRDEVTGDWGKLRNEELHYICTGQQILFG